MLDEEREIRVPGRLTNGACIFTFSSIILYYFLINPIVCEDPGECRPKTALDNYIFLGFCALPIIIGFVLLISGARYVLRTMKLLTEEEKTKFKSKIMKRLIVSTFLAVLVALLIAFP